MPLAHRFFRTPWGRSSNRGLFDTTLRHYRPYFHGVRLLRSRRPQPAEESITPTRRHRAELHHDTVALHQLQVPRDRARAGTTGGKPPPRPGPPPRCLRVQHDLRDGHRSGQERKLFRHGLFFRWELLHQFGLHVSRNIIDVLYL